MTEQEHKACDKGWQARLMHNKPATYKDGFEAGLAYVRNNPADMAACRVSIDTSYGMEEEQ